MRFTPGYQRIDRSWGRIGAQREQKGASARLCFLLLEIVPSNICHDRLPFGDFFLNLQHEKNILIPPHHILRLSLPFSVAFPSRRTETVLVGESRRI